MSEHIASIRWNRNGQAFGADHEQEEQIQGRRHHAHLSKSISALKPGPKAAIRP